MTHRRLLTTCGFGLAAMFASGFLTAASADVVYMDNFTLSLNGSTAFEDSFSAGLTLAGGAGAVLSSGMLFSDGITPAFYSVIGTVTGKGNKARLDTEQGAHLVQKPPFFPSARANIVTLLTGPPTGPFSTPFSLTPNDTFTTTGRFDLAVPPTPGGLYQVNLSDRVPSNMFLGDVISIAVVNCTPSVVQCGPRPGPYIQLIDANALTGTIKALASVSPDTSNQEILLELSHPTAGSDTVFGPYAYVNGGIEGPLTTIGSYDDLFTGLNYTQAGFVQLAPVPEPSSLILLTSSISGVLGIGWFRSPKASGRR